jgi:hypothetical protein
MSQETLEIAPKEAPVFDVFKQQVIPTFEGLVLTKVNPLKERFEQLKAAYKKASVINDKDGYKTTKEAVAAFRTFKGDVEDERKAIKSISLKMGEISDSLYEPLYDESEKLQKEHDAAAKAWDEEQKKIRNAEKEARAKRKSERIDKLTGMGAFTSSGVYLLGEASVSEENVDTLTDDLFADVLSRFQAAYAKIEEERKTEEEKKRQQAEELRQQQEQLRLQQEEMRKQQELIAEQQEALRKQQEELARKEKARQEEEEKKERWAKAEAERKSNEERNYTLRSRLAAFDDIEYGELTKELKYNGEVFMTATKLIDLPHDVFNHLVTDHNETNRAIKAEAERKRLEEEERYRIEREKRAVAATRMAMLSAFSTFIPANLMDMSEEEWEALYDKEKIAYDEKQHEIWLENERVKKIQEEEREKERLAELTDGERWRVFKNDLAKFAANIPDFPTGRYARMKAIALEKFGEIQALKYEQFKGNK